jgi:predicted  nucleic acid-binding Zn-ribbon protein
MRKIQSVVLLAGLALLMSRMAFSEVYKWVDKKGVTHFTDDMTQVPENFKPKAQTIDTYQEREDTRIEEDSAHPKKEDSYKDRLGRGEDYWKGRIEEWRNKLKEQQDKLGGLRAKYNALTERYNDSRSTAERATLRKERDQVKTEIDQSNAQIEESRSLIEKKIPEEAELYKANPEWIK